MTRSFPDGFTWGTATAAHQIEGGNWNNDWWAWEHTPGSGTTEPSGDACDSYHRYAEDHAIVADLGLDNYRFSVEWSRIEPEEGEFSIAALDHYKRVCEDLLARGVTPVITYHHFTTPRWVCPQDRVALLLHNRPEHLEALIGCWGARVVPFNVNYNYTPREVAELFGVRTTTIARWAREGVLSAVATPGGHRRYRRGEIAAALAKTTVPDEQRRIEQDAVRLYDQGWSIRRVAEAFDMSYGTMRRLLAKHTHLRDRGARRP